MELKGKIVFASGRATDFDIWTIDLASGKLTQITHGDDFNDTPRWSPDGSLIAFTSVGDDLISSICVMDKDGKNRRRLTDNMHCQHPNWSADGKKILFTANSPGTSEIEIRLFDLETNKSAVVFQRDGEETEPCLSPDGKKILFASTDPNSTVPFPDRDTDIWERDLSSGAERKICEHPARDYGPVYSPNGSQIAFISHRNGISEGEYLEALQTLKNNLNPKDRRSIDQTIVALREMTLDGDIYVANIDGTGLRALTSNDSLDIGVRWSPCGKYLVYSASSEGDVNAQRLKIIEVESGNIVPFEYDRSPFESEIGSDSDNYLNKRWFLKLFPDFLEKKLVTHFSSTALWGEERRPDWTYST
jgi:TolB protein